MACTKKYNLYQSNWHEAVTKLFSEKGSPDINPCLAGVLHPRVGGGERRGGGSEFLPYVEHKLRLLGYIEAADMHACLREGRRHPVRTIPTCRLKTHHILSLSAYPFLSYSLAANFYTPSLCTCHVQQ